MPCQSVLKYAQEQYIDLFDSSVLKKKVKFICGCLSLRIDLVAADRLQHFANMITKSWLSKTTMIDEVDLMHECTSYHHKLEKKNLKKETLQGEVSIVGFILVENDRFD